MSSEERDQLQVGILTICDPRGNWKYGWEVICRVAGLDPEKHPAPFRIRTEEDLRELGNASLAPAMPRVRPPKT